MPISLKQAASRAQDLYWQDYAPRDSFFDIKDFMFHFATVYSDMLNEIFQATRKENKREDGYSNVQIPAAWLISDVLTVQGEPEPIFPFEWDEFSYALDGIYPLSENRRCRPQKISREEAKYLDIAPQTSLCYYWLSGSSKISLINDMGKISASYVPAVDGSNGDALISETIAPKVIVRTLDLFFKSKNGNVVDEVNDGNTNEVMGQQVNPSLTKIQNS